jgi:hypothetical protein
MVARWTAGRGIGPAIPGGIGSGLPMPDSAQRMPDSAQFMSGLDPPATLDAGRSAGTMAGGRNPS